MSENPKIINDTNDRHYFVDEAGDLTLFNRKGKILVGSEGCSKYFILGTAMISKPHNVRQQLEELKKSVINDPYLKSIPSIQKTKTAFHAKDDCPEVRMQMYKFILNIDIRVFAIVRRKNFLVDWVKKNNQFDPDWKYNENLIYDSCVKRVFKDRLHSSPTNFITFSRRGKTLRNQALSIALSKAVQNFENTHNKKIETSFHVSSNFPSDDACLQIIDYCLWALQRMYEKNEDRHYNFLKEKFIRIIDLDDKRLKQYGAYYDKNNSLTLDKISDSLQG